MRGLMVIFLAAWIAGAFLYGVIIENDSDLQCSEFVWRGQKLHGRVVGRLDVSPKNVQFNFRAGEECTLRAIVRRWGDYSVGDELILSGGKVQRIEEFPEELGGYGEYLRRSGISGTLLYPSVELRDDAQASWHDAAWRSVRGRIDVVFVEPDAAIVAAMLLADKKSIPEDIVESFRHSGISHILAISGLHVSIVAGILVGLLSMLPIKPIYRTVAVLVVLWNYIWFINSPVSAARAGVFWTVMLMSLRLGVLASLPSAIMIAVVVLATLDPGIFADVGFQLSFSAVTGIWMALFLTKKKFVWLSVPIGASLGTAPLIMYHFGLATPLGLIANILAVPVVGIVIALSLLAVAVSYIWTMLAYVFAYGVHALLGWIIFVSKFVSGLPGASVAVMDVRVEYVVIYYVTLTVSFVLLVRRQGRNWREIWI